jgi:hypothetical protein
LDQQLERALETIAEVIKNPKSFENNSSSNNKKHSNNL